MLRDVPRHAPELPADVLQVRPAGVLGEARELFQPVHLPGHGRVVVAETGEAVQLRGGNASAFPTSRTALRKR